jgi:hypothetical protein
MKPSPKQALNLVFHITQLTQINYSKISLIRNYVIQNFETFQILA